MNLLLIDDQGMVREGLAMVLRAAADITAVREAASMADALKAPGPFDVVLAGHIGREASTEELVRRLHETFPVAKVLVLTAVENPAEVHIAFGAGATGYVLKQASAADLIEAVKTAPKPRFVTSSFTRAATAPRSRGAVACLLTLRSRVPILALTAMAAE
jgi:DNA-binding NarL/FixJ family response regulator